MTPNEAAKTIFSGMALVLALTTGGGAWGIFRGVITTVPKESGWAFLIITVIALASIPMMFRVFREEKKS